MGSVRTREAQFVALTLILEEKRRFVEEGIPRRIKAAVFFACPHPFKLKCGTMILADTNDEFIDIPTCHVLGAGDPYLTGAVALYNVCDEDTAVLFDHGKGPYMYEVTASQSLALLQFLQYNPYRTSIDDHHTFTLEVINAVERSLQKGQGSFGCQPVSDGFVTASIHVWRLIASVLCCTFSKGYIDSRTTALLYSLSPSNRCR
jgi:hypothetical protein